MMQEISSVLRKVPCCRGKVERKVEERSRSKTREASREMVNMDVYITSFDTR